MTPAETVAFIREFADRQDDFADPKYAQNSDADRQAFTHAAKMLRLVADRIEKKYKRTEI